MDTYCSYKIFNKQKLIVERYFGNVTWSEVMKLKKEETSDPLYDKGFSVLVDGRNASLNIDRKGMMDYVIKLIETMPYIGKRKSAILADTISHQFSSKMLMTMLIKMNISLKYVTTIPMAFQWLKITEQDSLEILKYLEEKK